MTRLLLLMALAGCAHASPVTWYLHGVAYLPDDLSESPLVGGYSSGQFVYDADTNLVTSFTVSDFGAQYPGWPFQLFPNTWQCCSPSVEESPTHINLYGLDHSDTPRNYLSLLLEQPLTNAGGTVGIVPSALPYPSLFDDSQEALRGGFGYSAYRRVSGGFISTDGPTTTPEPALWPVLLVSLGVLFYRSARHSWGFVKSGRDIGADCYIVSTMAQPVD